MKAAEGTRLFIRRHQAVKALISPALLVRRSFKRSWLSRALLEKTIDSLFAESPLLFVPEFEGVFRVGTHSHLFSRLLFEGKYEPLLAELSRRLINPDRDVIDVGANVGFFSVLASKHTQGRVLAIEPTEGALHLLRQNIVANCTGEKIFVFEGVVSNTSGNVTLSYINGKEEYSSIEPISHPSAINSPRSTMSVFSATLDELVEKNNLDPGFIKIDVEGAEHKVYAGAARVLSKMRPIFISEFSPRLLRANGANPDELIHALRSQNYRLIDPIDPKSPVGRREFGDLLGIPEELYAEEELVATLKEVHNVACR